MSEKRFTIKPQDDYWAVVDNYNEDKVCIINGIHTKIEAIWLCDFMNEQAEIIRKQSIRIYCQDKEVQRLLGELEQIPKSIREVWLE